MHVIAQVALCWTGVSLAFAAPLALLGYRRKLIREVNVPSPFGQQPCGDLSELGGLSQSNHSGSF